MVGPDDKVVLPAPVITIRARPINTAHFTADGGLACRPDVWPPRPPGAARAGRGGQVLLIATRLLLVTTHRLMTRAPRPPVPTERRPPPLLIGRSDMGRVRLWSLYYYSPASPCHKVQGKLVWVKAYDGVIGERHSCHRVEQSNTMYLLRLSAGRVDTFGI